MSLLPIAGAADLVKDKTTSAVINTDEHAYRVTKARRIAAMEVKRLEQTVESLVDLVTLLEERVGYLETQLNK